MATDNRTPNRDYRLPHADNLMKSEEVPRFITTFNMLDADIAAILAELEEKADAVHDHAMTEIIGLVAALAGKSPTGHNHGIGTLTGVDLSGAANGQFMKFNGTIWIPAALATADLANKIITNAKLRDSDALTVIGRALASVGAPADISATLNDTFLRRVSDALGFGGLTLGMVPDGLLTTAKLANEAVTFPKLATAAIATKTEAEAGTATDKLMSPLRTAQAIAASGPSINANALAKAWVNFNGTGTLAVRDSFNVSSVTDLGAGNYRINFATPIANANYAYSAEVESSTSQGKMILCTSLAASLEIQVRAIQNGNVQASTYAGGAPDVDKICVIVFGD
jgi:hypothetical protein